MLLKLAMLRIDARECSRCVCNIGCRFNADMRVDRVNVVMQRFFDAQEDP
jgi:hypothetical protein